MYDDRRYGRYVRANRWKAIFFTILFHALVVGAIAYYSDADVEQYLPEKVKDVLGMEVKDAEAEDVVRP